MLSGSHIRCWISTLRPTDSVVLFSWPLIFPTDFQTNSFVLNDLYWTFECTNFEIVGRNRLQVLSFIRLNLMDSIGSSASNVSKGVRLTICDLNKMTFNSCRTYSIYSFARSYDVTMCDTHRSRRIREMPVRPLESISRFNWSPDGRSWPEKIRAFDYLHSLIVFI